MSEKSATLRKIWTFVILTLAISSIAYIPMVLTGTGRDVGLLWMWSPGLAAILTQIFFKGSLKEFGWKLGSVKYLWLAITIPVVYSFTIYGFVWVTRIAGFRNPSTNLLIFLVPGLILACIAALGEEIGWRGFLVPNLFKITTFSRTVVITGILWSLWHYPVILWADYNSGVSLWTDIIKLTTAVIGMSAFTAWLRLKSGSIWSSVIWHGVHNFLVQEVLLSMTIKTTAGQLVVDDFGIGVTITGVILAIVFLYLGMKDGEHSENQSFELV